MGSVSRGELVGLLRNRWTIGTSILVIAVSFIVWQLGQFARDTSLTHWYDGPAGYLQAVKQQQQTNQPMVVFFYTDWCQSCEQLRAEILSSEPFKAFSLKLLPVKINPEYGPTEQALADSFRVVGYPSFYVIRHKMADPVRIKKTNRISPELFIQQCQQAIES